MTSNVTVIEPRMQFAQDMSTMTSLTDNVIVADQKVLQRKDLSVADVVTLDDISQEYLLKAIKWGARPHEEINKKHSKLGGKTSLIGKAYDCYILFGVPYYHWM
ncbi:MAG: hypothetical protein F6K11_25490 [Leptolyngbya sp. SIO3F4]|nr:hypothetical protein [Leptolyngbya sp. SIO3F4]